MANLKTFRFVLATFLIFGTTVALYEWNQSVSGQQAQPASSIDQPSHSQSKKMN